MLDVVRARTRRTSTPTSTSTVRRLGATGAVCLAVSLGVGAVGLPAQAAEAPVNLGTATSFAVLAGQSITNTGPSVVSGDIGVGPGTAVSGIPPLVQNNGAPHVADAVANQAQADLVTAYTSAAGRSTVTDITGQDLGGMTLTSGVVEHTSGMQLTGTLTLDAQGDPSAVFIFKAGSTLITAPNSTVSLINGASPCNVYWQVGSSATLDTSTTFVGTVMALTSATLATGASVQGRVLARNGSVTLDTNLISRPSCTSPASPTPTPTTSPTATPSTTSPTASPSASATPSATPSPGSGNGGGGNGGGNGNGNDNGGSGDSDDNGSGDNGSDNGGSGGDATGGSTDGSLDTPVVPTGHPETGLGGEAPPAGPGWGSLALLGAAAVAASALRWRRPRSARLS